MVLKQKGLIYEDDFTNISLDASWEVNPNDLSRYSLTEVGGSLRLKHGVDPVYLFFTPLTNIPQFVFDMKNIYNPTIDGDVGGLVVYADTMDYISLEEYYDAVLGVTKTYPWLRLVREYNIYQAYWSEDGYTWNFIGTQQIDREAPKIGCFLRGTEGEPLDIDYIRICSSIYFTVSNLVEGTRVDLLDTNNNILETRVCPKGSTRVVFNLVKHGIPFPCKFQITTVNGDIFIDDTVYTVWGGDEYAFKPSPLDLYYINAQGMEVKIDPGLEEFLGYLNSGGYLYKDIKMLAKNSMMHGEVSNITVKVISYKDPDDYLLVQVANDVNGIPDQFGEQINLPNIGAGGTAIFWLRVNRPSDETGSEIYFGLDVGSAYSY